MQFLTDTNIQFMKYRKGIVWVSITLLVVALLEIFILPWIYPAIGTGSFFSRRKAGLNSLLV